MTDMKKDLDPAGENIPTHRELVFDIGEDPALSPGMISGPLTIQTLIWTVRGM